MRTILLLLALFAACLLIGSASGAAQARAASPAASELANQIVAAVNELREEEGLATLNIHPTLMQLAQAHAEYMASSGQSSHLDGMGRRPFQRALAAGYPVAGDLTLGGFYSENIMTGPDLSANELIQMWMGDALHQNTMLSEYRSDMGAGVAYAGGAGYYVLDTALAGSNRAVITLSASPSPGQSIYVIVPAATSTPMADGSIVHTVRAGETLWGIAAVYGASVEQVALLNRISPESFLQPGDRLLVREALAAAPENPSAAPDIPSIATSTPRQYGAMDLATRKPEAAGRPQSAGIPLTRLVGWILLAVSIIGGILWAADWIKDRDRPGQ